jgi:23S rRNA pseudouridine1911/1915/1917 synthase
MSFPTLYEDAHCFVLDKPSGIATVTEGKGDGTVVYSLGIEENLLVHRLDRGTSGCLLIAKDNEARQFLQQQFKDRTVEKTYLAVVAGILDPPEAVISAPIGRSPTDGTAMSVYRSPKVRTARTSYRTIARGEAASLLACRPETGRTHQVRVHLKSIGHPILGDQAYGNKASKKVSEAHGISRLCLHAWKLRFQSPHQRDVEVEAPLPAELQKYLKNLNIPEPHF